MWATSAISKKTAKNSPNLATMVVTKHLRFYRFLNCRLQTCSLKIVLGASERDPFYIIDPGQGQIL
jgi:hypothetical protein